MKRFFTLLIGLVLTNISWSYAQQDTVGSFTLDQCIQYGLQNAISVRNSEVDQQIAIAKVREVTGSGLPQISATGGLIHNPKLARFFTTYVAGQQSFVPGLDQIPGIKSGDVIGIKNFLQLQSSGTASVTANETLNYSYFIGLKATRTVRELSIRNTNQTKEQVIVQVTKAYYAVIINKERIKLFTNNIARVDSLLRSTKALNQNGFAESIDVDRIQVNLNNLMADRDKFENTNELSMALLKFQMNYPMDQEINVVGNIQEVQVDNPIEAYKQNWDYKLRPDYQVLETNKKIQDLTITNKYAASMPTLGLFATYGYSTQSPNISGLFKNNSAISDDGTFGPDKWYNYSQIGLNLTVPIFSGGQRHYQLQQEKLNLVKIQNNFKNLKNSIDLDVEQSSVNFENALKSLTAQKSNMELASKVARVTKIKYEQGVGSNIEVVDAENSLRQAQTNYYSALYDAMVAKVDIEKAFGKILPNYSAQ